MSDARTEAVFKSVLTLLDILSPARREGVRQHLVKQGVDMLPKAKGGRRPRSAALPPAGGR